MCNYFHIRSSFIVSRHLFFISYTLKFLFISFCYLFLTFLHLTTESKFSFIFLYIDLFSIFLPFLIWSLRLYCSLFSSCHESYPTICSVSPGSYFLWQFLSRSASLACLAVTLNLRNYYLVLLTSMHSPFLPFSTSFHSWTSGFLPSFLSSFKTSSHVSFFSFLYTSFFSRSVLFLSISYYYVLHFLSFWASDSFLLYLPI